MNQRDAIEITSPLGGIDVSFARYVSKRKAQESQHLVGGVPDYSFDLDNEMRKKLNAIPGFYSVAKKLCATYVAREIQLLNQSGLAVGPNQFPEIYQMGVECAGRLGIGVPNIYIKNVTEMNAYTVAGDDSAPTIILFSGIVERMTPGELKCVIGHECGHVHNQHGVYQVAVDYILRSGKGMAGLILSGANMALMQFWTRAAEITADRAAVICADRVEDAVGVNKKLTYGAMLGGEYDVNIDALREQLEITMKNPTKILEITANHPNSIRRVLADLEFAECEVFYRWRPEMKRPGVVERTKEQTDARCKKLVNIIDNK